MKIPIQIFLLVIALWSAHLAGALYAGAREDRKYRLAAILRTIYSIFAATLVLVV